MIKGLKILFFILSLGIFLFPQQNFSAQDINSHETCCCSENPKHQATESADECCGTSCEDCILHSNNISVFYSESENFQAKKFFLETKSINSFIYFSLPKSIHNIWKPPKIS